MTANGFAKAGPPVTVAEKVRFLSDPGTYAHDPATVEVIETHMSWVFLAGPKVFKLKKPVRYDFLDFSTIGKRRRAVCDEVQLNRRLAPDLYEVPRPLGIGADGRLSLDGARGQVVDWLVEMRRLPEERNLERMIGAGDLTPGHIGQVADLLRGFYGATPPAEIAPEDYAGQFAAEYAKTRAVLTDPALKLDEPQLDAALDAYDRSYAEAHPLLCQRVRAGHVVEGHGDLRPEHVFLTDAPVIIDCLEFNRALRLVDPLDEIAFLGMECAKLGPEWVAGALYHGLGAALGNPPPVLVEFYWRYRALLRARLSLLHLVVQPERTPWKWRPQARRYVALSCRPELMRLPPEGR
ncbi:MAG: hypothetical protein P1U75_02105 [Antarcticimicrobium sp.]|uniref:hypothetical protein n=1 Tax=Antarcticimicrobium sp. TaxID=2824147 RepID=UPI002628CCE3|nr:hypothetical protein [Antarcticimicrobium sp.]MDF1715455.1 hypothetical protein [Antarcticimicrobium sp.]